MTAKKLCIVCHRSIAKRTQAIYVKPTTSGGRDSEAAVFADLRTKADCQRHTNLQVISFVRWADGLIRSFNVWDGESFVDDFFCTNNCAMAQGHASAQHGHRYVWKERPR